MALSFGMGPGLSRAGDRVAKKVEIRHRGEGNERFPHNVIDLIKWSFFRALMRLRAEFLHR